MRAARLGAAVLAAALTSACLVDVRKVDDPREAFDRARSEASRLHGRRGTAASLNLLAWDPHDHELVRLSIPLALVRKLDDADLDLDLDERGERLERRLKGRLTLRELERAGLGILVEVDEEDGERVLIWLR
jgi:hypothetical protein